MLLYLNCNKRLETFLKIANYSEFIRSSNGIKLYQDRLKMMKVRCPILGFFQLVIRVFSKLTPNIVKKSLGIPKIFSKESFELKPYDQSNAFVAAVMLSPFEADGAIEK